jgi:hypothetical protein
MLIVCFVERGIGTLMLLAGQSTCCRTLTCRCVAISKTSYREPATRCDWSHSQTVGGVADRGREVGLLFLAMPSRA